jgi:hypothetical protein
MTKKRSVDYLSALNKPGLEVPRRMALQLLQLTREMEGGHFPDARDDAGERFFKLDCVNCDAKISNAGLYCGELCQQTAITVRYVRKAIADGRIVKPDIQNAIGMLLLHLYGGGYPSKKRKLSADQRMAILERDDYTCALCGAAATEIDHIAGSSSASSNLRALCKPCNVATAWQNARTVTPDENLDEWLRITEFERGLAQRISAPQPLRFCDNLRTVEQNTRSYARRASEVVART